MGGGQEGGTQSGEKEMTDQLLDNRRTPAQIAERITASPGIHLTDRTVWEKARRLGIAKKVGRSMFISIDDVPKLLQQEKERHVPISKANALEILRRHRKKQENAKQESK